MLCAPLANARFHTIRSLGHGATSRVFEVEDQTNGGRFALKQLRHERLSAERIARFKDEFRALERISHPNVAKVYELLADDQGVYLLMELVEGVDFIRYVRPGSCAGAAVTESGTERRAEEPLAAETEGAALSIERLRAALAQLVHGLRALHASGGIHCDIKPENVLITRDGHVVIVDFGLLTEAVHDTRCRGTPAFMAPEQFAGTYAEATDWYAVGMLLYVALCGRLPDEGSPNSMAQTRRARRPPDPRLHCAQLPDDLVELSLWLLEPEPARRPPGEVIARILGVEPKLATVQRVDSVFIGRARELGHLRAAFSDARQGGRAVHLHGESGIGKTALIRCFAREMSEHGALVFRGACYRDASVPYKALDAIVDRLAVHLSRLKLSGDDADHAALALMFPVFRVVSGRGIEPAVAEQDPLLIRARAVLAFRELLAQLAEQRGIVLCIDDMQWTDLESIELLANLMHPPAPVGLLLVLGYRSSPEGWGSRVQNVRQNLPCHHDLALSPLDAAAVRALVERSAAVEQEELEVILRESAGNPFFVGELVRARSARNGQKAISLSSVLSLRMNALAPSYHPYLELVSASGRPVEERVLRRALGITQEALLETRRVLVAESLVRIAEEEGCPIEPYHDRIREHVLHELVPERLRAHHRSLAEAYQVEGVDDPEILAFHYRAADDRERALTYTERAGDAAVGALAFGRGADLYEAALQLELGGARAPLLVKHANALSHAARPAAAADNFMAALDHFPSDVELKLRAGEECVKAGQIDRGLAFFSEVATTTGWSIPKRPGLVLLSLLWHELKLRRSGVRVAQLREVSARDKQSLNICITSARQLVLVDPVLAALFQRRHLQMALQAGSRIDLVHALAIEAGFSAMLSLIVNGISRAEGFCRLASELAEPSDSPFTRGLPHSARGMIALARGDLRASRAAQEQALEIYRSKQGVNLRWELAFCQSYIIVLLLIDADFPTMHQRIQPYMLEASGYPLLETLQALWWAVKLALCDDSPAEARRIITTRMVAWPTDSWRLQHFTALLALGDVGLYEGDLEATWQYLESTWKRWRKAGFHWLRSYFPLALALRARLALALRLPREAERSIRALMRRSEICAKELGKALKACLLAARGERQQAIVLLQSAIPGLTECGAGLFAIAARHRLAILSGDRALEQAALDTLRERGVRAPEKLVDALLPLRAAERDGRRK
jgi:tRNA A-37 threonylcarbamoyl transferase component Bud32